jgi:hypothetical protein
MFFIHYRLKGVLRASEKPASKNPARIRIPSLLSSPLLKQDPPLPQQLEFTLTALCTAQVGSFFADFLSVSDECSVEFASLEFPQKKVVQNLSLTPFAPLSNVCVESKAKQTPSFFAVNCLLGTTFGAELLGVKPHNAYHD